MRRIRIDNIQNGKSVLETLQVQGEYIPAPCGGNGTCGKCRVRFVQNPPVPSQADLAVLTKDEIEDGVRLACRVTAAEGAVIEILTDGEINMEVSAGFMCERGAASASEERTVSESGRKDRIEGDSKAGNNRKCGKITEADVEGDSKALANRESEKSPKVGVEGDSKAGDSGKSEKGPEADVKGDSKAGGNRESEKSPEAGVEGDSKAGNSGKMMKKSASGETAETGQITAAVDIGTTTIAMSAVHTGSGRILGTATGINRQRAWGADVISRMEASNQGKGDLLRRSILADLDLLGKKLGLPEDTHMVISGNSTMEHLLQGLSCQTLGVAPYTPVDISLHEYENMTILPGISTFVGADIVSGIVACGIDQSEEICILVDLGTNGEMAIGNRERIISASTAAGPAFEGGNISCGVAGIPGAVSSVEITDGEARVHTIGNQSPVGLCGTGVLETVYELLKEELIDETGLMDDDYFDDGFPVTEDILFTNKDVREVQLAKSAVRAGLEVLLKEYGADYDEIGKLYIAGGFGQKINLEKAVGIGLLPEELLDRMIPVGNSSLAGAVMAACDPSILERMRAVGENAEETALAENPLFSELYMDHMFFPEQD